MIIFLLFLLQALLLAIIVAVPVVFALEIIGWAWTGVPYVPLKKHIIERLPAVLALDEYSVLYDLGCGDGRVLFELGKKSSAQFIGVEKAPFPFFAAKLKEFFYKKKNVRIIFGDIFSTPLHSATHVYLYLFTEVMEKLLPILEKKLRPGTTVVSCDFKFRKKAPSKTIPIGEGRTAHTLYVYDF